MGNCLIAGQLRWATWVPRERNKHADRLANEAMDAVSGRPSAKGAPNGTRARRDSGPAGLW